MQLAREEENPVPQSPCMSHASCLCALVLVLKYQTNNGFQLPMDHLPESVDPVFFLSPAINQKWLPLYLVPYQLSIPDG